MRNKSPVFSNLKGNCLRQLFKESFFTGQKSSNNFLGNKQSIQTSGTRGRATGEGAYLLVDK
jgi:hypothetical protein